MVEGNKVGWYEVKAMRDDYKRLIELAAYAVGKRNWEWAGSTFLSDGVPWNPFDDDADSFRLANALCIQTEHHKFRDQCAAGVEYCAKTISYDTWFDSDSKITYDRNSAMRYCILHVAASIGAREYKEAIGAEYGSIEATLILDGYRGD